jgi:hypothetical protein
MTNPEEPKSTTLEHKVIPMIGPILSMLGSRKGIVMLSVVIGVFTAISLGKMHFAEVKEFLGALFVAYFGATAYEDAKKHEHK